MTAIRTTLALAAVTAACAALPACHSRGDPLSGVSGTQVLDMAVSSLKAAPGFTVAGTADEHGRDLVLKLRYRDRV